MFRRLKQLQLFVTQESRYYLCHYLSIGIQKLPTCLCDSGECDPGS